MVALAENGGIGSPRGCCDGLVIGNYVYDAQNRRIQKTISNGGLTGNIPNGTTDYLWLSWQTMEERNPFGGSGSTDTPVRQYVWGLESGSRHNGSRVWPQDGQMQGRATSHIATKIWRESMRPQMAVLRPNPQGRVSPPTKPASLRLGVSPLLDTPRCRSLARGRIKHVAAPLWHEPDSPIDECVQLTTLVVLGPQSLPAGAYYLCQDLLYRAVALTNSSGAVVEAYDTDAYGNSLIFTGPGTDGVWFTDDDVQSDFGANDIIYCGYRFDPETQLYYVRNRSYSPILGRWIQRDPIGYAAGSSLYLYMRGRPSSRKDPSGLRAWPAGSGMPFPWAGTPLPPWPSGIPRIRPSWPPPYIWNGGGPSSSPSGPPVVWHRNPYIGPTLPPYVGVSPSGGPDLTPGGRAGATPRPAPCCGSTFWCIFDIAALIPEIIIINHAMALIVAGTAGPDEVAPEISLPAQILIIAGALWKGRGLVEDMKCDCKSPGASASASSTAGVLAGEFEARAKEAWHAVKAFRETVPEP